LATNDNGSGAGGSLPLGRTQQLVEVCIFLLLLSPIAFATEDVSVHSGRNAVVGILYMSARIGLILYFLWRNGEPLARIGLTLVSGWKEAAVGIVWFIPVLFADGLLLASIFPERERDLRGYDLSLVGNFLVFISYVIAAFEEEVICRGYLLLRFTALTGSRSKGALLSLVIFALSHCSQGLFGIVSAGFVGLALTLIYLWRRSLVAPFVIHFLINLTIVYILPFVPE
jgi:membrane protease YdiL (CAAX protease family)